MITLGVSPINPGTSHGKRKALTLKFFIRTSKAASAIPKSRFYQGTRDICFANDGIGKIEGVWYNDFFVSRKTMPLYEYKCTKCGSVFEVLQKVDDPPLKKCVRCQGPVKKLLSPPALQFKGSGWYVTDYASKGKPAPDHQSKDKAKNGADSPKGKKDPDLSSPEKK